MESERCATFKAAMDAGKPVYAEVSQTLADGTYTYTVGLHNVQPSKQQICPQCQFKHVNYIHIFLKVFESRQMDLLGVNLVVGCKSACKSVMNNVFNSMLYFHCFFVYMCVGVCVCVCVVGLAVPEVGVNAFHTAAPLLDKLVTVK